MTLPDIDKLLHAMTCRKPHPTNYDYFCEYRDVEIPKTSKAIKSEIIRMLEKLKQDRWYYTDNNNKVTPAIPIDKLDELIRSYI